MTPAERDEVRDAAGARTLAHDRGSPCKCRDCKRDFAILRYVPAGDATHVNVHLRVDSDMSPAWRRTVAVGGACVGESWLFNLSEVRDVAHALHAAADAAEDS